MPARLPDVRRGRTPVRRRTPPDLCRTHGRGRTLRPAPPRGHGLPDAQHPARQHPAEHVAPPPAGDSLPRFGVAGTDGTQPDRGGALARRQFTPTRTGFDTFGGQQQRLCLARTLALEPEILLLDEPTASLDPATTHTIENLLLKLAERYPILLVSHGLPQAQRMASRIVLFGKGRLQGMLSPEELPNEAEMNRFFDGGDAGNR